MRHWPVRVLASPLGIGLVIASMLAPTPAASRPPHWTQKLTLGDFVLRYELIATVRGERGAAVRLFDATLENRSRIDVGAIRLDVTSRSPDVVVLQGGLEFPALAAGARVASTLRLRIVQAPRRPLGPEDLRFEFRSAAPALAVSAPAAGALGFPESEWIVLGFEAPPAPDVERGFALDCAGARVAIDVHPLGERLVLNPSPQLPANASCGLGWVGPGARAVELAFTTGLSGAAASVRYDRADTSKSNPLPDDFFTLPDVSAATGLRVQIPIPTADAGTRLLLGAMLAEANELDGFSPHGPIVLELSEPPGADSVPRSPEASLDPLSPVVLLDLTPNSPQRGERVPFATHVRGDRMANGSVEHVLFVYPAVQLQRGGRYALVMSRRLTAESGRPFALSSYLSAALADPEPGEGASLAKLRPLVREGASAAASLDPPIPAEDLAFVLRFSVGSLAGAFETPLALRQQVNARSPPIVTITRVERSFSDTVAAIVEGTFDAPYWIDDSGILVRDAQGRPEIQGTDSIPFVLALPRSAATRPAPAVFYQHGWPGTASEVRSQAEQELARAGFAVAGFTDSINRFYGPDLGAQSRGIYLTLLWTRRLPGFWMQTLGEQLAFLRALAELADLDLLPLGAPDGVPDIDLSKLFYAGVSGGATQGAMLLPYAPEIAAAHLAVGSGRLVETTVHQESPQGSNVLPLVRLAFPKLPPSELWSSLHVLQMIFDEQEAQTHAARLFRDPIEVDGTTRKPSILWSEGLNDGQSPPTARRAAANAIGLPLLEPVREAVAVLSTEPTPVSANIDAATTGGVFQYVPGGVPGVPATADCEGTSEGHFCGAASHPALLQRALFFVSALGGPPIIANPFLDGDQDGLGDVDEALRGTDPLLTDSDGDGMPDGFEVSNRLDPLDAGDGAPDPDGDGLANREEYEAGTGLINPDTDRDGLWDGAEVNVYGTKPTLADSDGGGRSDGEEVDRDGTDPRVGSDDLPLRTLPARFTDGAGFFWLVMPTGGIPYGDCCEDDEQVSDLGIGTTSFPPLQDAPLEDGSELVLGPVEIAGLSVTRKVFVSPTERFLRHLVILENPTAAEVTTPVFLRFDFNGDTIADTSSGDAQLDSDDDWLRSAGDEGKLIVIGFSGPLADLQPSSAPGSSIRFDVRVPAGERAILLSFHAKNETAADAQESVERMVRLEESLLSAMSAEERADVVNYVALPDADHDGLADSSEAVLGTDPASPDTDGDGLLDGFEARAGLDPLAPGDGAGDADGDGLDDLTEQGLGTHPRKADTDGDGLSDGSEVGAGTGPRERDSDGDGLSDGEEALVSGTDPLRLDTDADGLGDALELRSLGTNPLEPDSDADGLPDGVEVQEPSFDPLDPADGGLDPDRDGLTNADEFRFGTRYRSSDTDRDGLSDGQEALVFGSDPLRVDSDGGGRDDRRELISDETDPLDGADELPRVALPARLFDSAGFPWDVQRSGEISGLPSCASCGRVRSGLVTLSASSEAVATSEELGRELRIDARAVFGNVRFRRKVFVPTDDEFARYLDSFENTGSAAITIKLQLESTLRSSALTGIVGSSDGDADAESSDDFAVADDAEGTGIAPFAFVYSDAAAPLQPASVLFDTNGRIEVTFLLILAPGERRTLMSFLSQSSDRETAIARGSVLRDLGGSALVGLSDGERAQIANFALP